MSLRRNVKGQLGFHIFYEGLVAEVEPYGMAWQAGLRKGSRLLEVCLIYVVRVMLFTYNLCQKSSDTCVISVAY